MEEQQIIDIWEMFREYIVEKNRDTAASQYIDFLIGQDIDTDVIEGLKGYDAHLDQAIDLVLENNSNEENDKDDENWNYDEEEDEDY